MKRKFTFKGEGEFNKNVVPAFVDISSLIKYIERKFDLDCLIKIRKVRLTSQRGKRE
jgi:hypothetical protein